MLRSLTFFAFTAIVAGLLALLVRNALRQKEAQIEALKNGTVPVVVAAHDLQPGAILDAASVKLAPWPRNHTPIGVVFEIQPLVNNIVKRALSADEPVLSADLLDARKVGGALPLLIPRGMRAVSIGVDDVSDLSGFVLPGTHVDVLVSIQANTDGKQEQCSRTVLQNIEVLAVEQKLEAAGGEPSSAKVITVMVAPAQAERLATASQMGSLHLAMRGFNDSAIVDTVGADASEIMGNPSIKPMVPVKQHRQNKPGPMIEVIRNGMDRQRLYFVDGNETFNPGNPSMSALNDGAVEGNDAAAAALPDRDH